MRLWKKIYIFYLILFITTVCIYSYIINIYTFDRSLENEIIRARKRAHDISLVTASMLHDDIPDFPDSFIALLKTKTFFIEILDSNGQVLVSDKSYIWDSIHRSGAFTIIKEDNDYTLIELDDIYYLNIKGKINDEYKYSTLTDITYLYNQVQERKRFFLILFIICLAIMSAAAPLISISINRPLHRIQNAMDEVSKGEYNTKLPATSKDELGMLFYKFNVMASEVKSRVVELSAANETRQRILDNLVHELRTPMTSVIGYSEYLMNTKYDEEVFYKGLNYIYSEGQRVLDFSNKLMDITYLGKYGINKEMHNIYELLNEVADTMRVKLKKKQMDVKVQGADLIVEMDRELIKWVVTNLIDNAANASEESSAIIIGCKKNGNKACIFVKDKGRGIPKEELTKIMEPFYRIDKARSRKNGGAGLGLAICNEIAKLHNADITIDSEIGKGTTVEISL